ncbi:MBL fold metallo-hydrolase [Paucisalibacillus sp. EB02]|uniref:MBL fold metallo-hydrolase n=1 Tax=Paucisalibacillus sp. EB02 TaxID=1347087 RepID=UPI0005AA6370|nr:MBL fold metallo-hydrolase [Paucisalibacillus sp. EB02]
MEISSKHFTLEKVSRNAYAAIAKEGSGSVANAGFVDLGGKSIVFDTFNTQQASEDLKTFAESITNHPVTWVINSHWHGDHIRGNQSFKERTIISSGITFSKIKELHPSRINTQKNDLQGLSNYIKSLQSQLTHSEDKRLAYQINFLKELEKSLPTLELILPNQTFTSELSFHGENCNAKLFTLGGGHSVCDSVLYIPEDKVIFMGDLLFVKCHPTFFEESNPSIWVEILRRIEGLEFDIAIPGHGPVGTKEDVTKLITYITDIKEIVIENDRFEEVEIPDTYKDWESPEVYQQSLKMLSQDVNSLAYDDLKRES